MSRKDLTIEKVLEIEKLGLSLGDSARLLGVVSVYLEKFIIKNKIKWRDLSPVVKKRAVNKNCEYQRAKAAGVNYNNMKYRMRVLGLTVEEAIDVGLIKDKK